MESAPQQGSKTRKWIVGVLAVILLVPCAFCGFFGLLIAKRDAGREQACRTTLERVVAERMPLAVFEERFSHAPLTPRELAEDEVLQAWSHDIGPRLRAGEQARQLNLSDTYWIAFFGKDGRATGYLCIVT